MIDQRKVGDGRSGENELEREVQIKAWKVRRRARLALTDNSYSRGPGWRECRANFGGRIVVTGPTRFLANQTAEYRSYVTAAQQYVSKLSPEERDWLRRKPYDQSSGHQQWFDVMYLAMNIIRVMDLPASANVLEVGAGPGWITEILLMLGYNVVAVEPAADMISIARARVAALKSHYGIDIAERVQFHTQSIEESNFPQGVFDGVLFYDALHHVIDDQRTLRVCFETLKPGGVLGLVEGAWHPTFKELEKSLTEEMKKFGTLENPFDQEHLDQQLRTIGFTDITRYIAINGFFPVAIDNSTLRAVAWGPAATRNDLTARKPQNASLPEWVVDISIVSCRASFNAEFGRSLFVSLVLQNRGSAVLAKGGNAPGAINVALRRHAPDESIEEAPHRLPLPHALASGQSIELSHTFSLKDHQSFEGWSLELVREQVCWLEALGVRPQPVYPNLEPSD